MGGVMPPELEHIAPIDLVLMNLLANLEYLYDEHLTISHRR